jgi:hypothetical protein
MHLDPALAAQYFDTLLTCLDDAGSGAARHRTHCPALARMLSMRCLRAGLRVRQNAVKLIRDIMFADANSLSGMQPASEPQQRLIRASIRLLQAASKPTEDERTKDSIKEVFETLWFTGVPATKRKQLPLSAVPFLPQPDALTPVANRLQEDVIDVDDDGVDPITPGVDMWGDVRSPTVAKGGMPSPAPVTPAPTLGSKDPKSDVFQARAYQIVTLVALENSTDWLASMVRRFIYGSDAVADPRLKVRRVIIIVRCDTRRSLGYAAVMHCMLPCAGEASRQEAERQARC